MDDRTWPVHERDAEREGSFGLCGQATSRFATEEAPVTCGPCAAIIADPDGDLI